MVDINKLYKMIKVMGKMDLKSLSARFPSETMESLRNIIEDTHGLEIVGSFVRIREENNEDQIIKPTITQKIEVTKEDTVEEIPTETLSHEEIFDEELAATEEMIKEEVLEEEIIQDKVLIQEDIIAEELNVIKNITATGEICIESGISQTSSSKAYTQLKNSISPTGAIIKSFNSENLIELRDVSKKKSTKVGSDLSFEKVLNLIDKYNEKMEEELKKLMGDLETRKEDAIYQYLTDRYTIEPYKKYDATVIVSQFDKITNSMRGYAVITKDFTQETFDLIDSLFDSDMVFIYYTNENLIGMPNTTKEFFLRPTDAILSEYMLDFELKKINVELSQIVRSDTGELIDLDS